MRIRGRLLTTGMLALSLMTVPWVAQAEEAAPASPNAAMTTNAPTIAAELGVLKGDGQGVTAAYLSKSTTRMQAAILYLRLLGKEKDALAEKGTDTFSDAGTAGKSNAPILAFLKSHPEYGWSGTGGNKFEPNGLVTSQQLYKVMLEALGYRSGTDFDYKDTLVFAASKGLSRAATATPFKNSDLATALIETLQTMTKTGGKTLVAQLVELKVVTADQAAKLNVGRIDVRKATDGSSYLTDGKGMALYLFTKDTADVNSCVGQCLANWPVFYSDAILLANGLSGSDFGSFVRADGAKQLTYKGWPLYYFVKDTKAGDVNGEGIGNVWYLIKQPFYTVGLGTDPKLGNYLVDSNGKSLYYFDKDPIGASECSGDCLAKWPAFHADAIQVPKGLNAKDFSEITREDGTKQTTFKGYPLYYFFQDTKRGEVKGQGLGTVWYVIDPATFAGTKTGLAQPAKVTVEMKDYAFQQADITVKAGTPIEFINRDEDMKHNAVAVNGAFGTPLLEQGQTTIITLTKPGVYEYYCEAHKSFMKGKITVQ
ncbi:plastocyanin/azurin family copper-binding protein [Cohnella yongneupensis]|uniref:Plastocyanin/azurin family copper-binding protein n=1 Tax=Cohnella yongneupensis TaxID=425006 RepID=A0ABW0R476_9BACL